MVNGHLYNINDHLLDGHSSRTAPININSPIVAQIINYHVDIFRHFCHFYPSDILKSEDILWNCTGKLELNSEMLKSILSKSKSEKQFLKVLKKVLNGFQSH